jgi:hypothetical protein
LAGIQQIIDPGNPKRDHWVYVIRKGDKSIFGVVLDGSGPANSEGVRMNLNSLGDCYYCPNCSLDLAQSSFKHFPVCLYGKITPTNPLGEYTIHSLTGSVSPSPVAAQVAPKSAPKSGSQTVSSPVGVNRDDLESEPDYSFDILNSPSSAATESATAVLDQVTITTQVTSVDVPESVKPVTSKPVIPKPVTPKLPIPKPAIPKLDQLVLPDSSALNSVTMDGSPVIAVDELPFYLEAAHSNNQSVMVWGPAGVGKSAGINQYAIERGKNLRTVLLSMVDPTMLKGIGVPDIVNQKMIWLPDESIPTEPNSILFLDEITTAPPTIQALAYQIAWDKAVGSKPLPPDCQVIFAGNRTTDRGVAYNMPSPLANRVTHLTIHPTIAAWRKWAYTVGIDARLISFLSLKPDLLHKMDAARSGGAWPSPRSWANADSYLKSRLSLKRIAVAMAGCVGVEEVKEFVRFCADFQKYASRVEGVLSGHNRSRETDPSKAITIAVAVAANATDDFEVLSNVINWANRQDQEYRSVVLNGLEDRFGAATLMEIPGYVGVVDSNALPF